MNLRCPSFKPGLEQLSPLAYDPCRLEHFLPSTYAEIKDLGHCESRNESRGCVVGEHDGDEDKGPDEEAHREQDPEEEQEFDLFSSPDDQQYIHQGVPEIREIRTSYHVNQIRRNFKKIIILKRSTYQEREWNPAALFWWAS